MLSLIGIETPDLAMGLCRGRGVAAGFAILIGLGGTALGDSGLDDFMARDGQLRDELQVRDGQHGVVGETGTLWVIEPSGAFTVSRFVNSKVGPTERAGSLTPEQIELVAQSLARQRFGDLPQRIGEGASANPRVISVVFGEDRATLVLPPGAPVELQRVVAQQTDQPGPGAQLLAVVGTVLEVTAAD
jgi:hypothetical protein